MENADNIDMERQRVEKPAAFKTEIGIKMPVVYIQHNFQSTLRSVS